MMTYRPSARARSTVCFTCAMNAGLIVPLVELKSHATGMRRVLNPLSLMESISALVGGAYPQKESKVFPRLMPGFGKTGAADPTEEKARHAMVTMKHFNLFRVIRPPSVRLFAPMRACDEVVFIRFWR